MGRTLAVMLVPYPPGIPLIMPGERITAATKSIHDYLLYARDFDQKFPGFETDIHGLRFEPTADGQALSGRLRRARERAMIPRDVKAPTIADPVPQAAEGRRDRRRRAIRRPRSCSTTSPPRASKSRSATASTGTSPRMPRSAPTSRSVDGERLEQARKLGALGSRDRLPHAAVGAGRFAPHLRHGGPRPHRRGRRLHLSRPADARLLRQAGRRQPREVRHDAAAAVLRRPDGLRRRGEHRLRLPGTPGRPVLPEVARRASSSSSISARASSATTCATPTSISATC